MAFWMLFTSRELGTNQMKARGRREQATYNLSRCLNDIENPQIVQIILFDSYEYIEKGSKHLRSEALR